MNSDLLKLLYQAFVAQLIASGKVRMEFKEDKKSGSDDVLNKALSAKRLLPGAKVVRNGRPLTDYMAKIKKSQRRQLKGEYLKYRSKSVKGPQKALVTSVRAQANKPYKSKSK